jgi:hypothetical protein
MKTEEKPKSNKKKAILISLGVVATAVGGFFGFKYLKNRKKNNSFDDEESAPVTTTSSTQTSTSSNSSGGYKSTSSTTTTRKDSFPLKKGSKGDRVKLFQEKLIAKYGKSILPKYGADGDFGSEMEAALEKLKLPTTISESAYNVYVKGAAPDSDDLAEKLIDAAENKNFTNAIDNLKKIRNTSDYSSVSEKFKEMRINGGVRKTLVTGMLDTFTSSSQQEAIRAQFLRMGLKYDGSKWSVPTNFNFFSGIDEPLLITTEPTELYDPKYLVKVKVPKDMVVGRKIKEKNGFTLLRMLEKNRKLIVKSSTVKIYEKH